MYGYLQQGFAYLSVRHHQIAEAEELEDKGCQLEYDWNNKL